jgi:predicted lipoprotein with Yx(FWY)xxD motif
MHLTRKLTQPVAALVLLLVAGCGSDAAAPAAAPAASSAPAPSASSATGPSSSASGDLAVADSPLGKILVDGKGMTVYFFTKDEAGSGTSVCSGDCLVAWPAVVAASSTPSGEGVTAELGTISRDDGTKQVTVAGLPVYLFQKDKAPGDVTGQGVGKVWYVVAPDGTMITTAP